MRWVGGWDRGIHLRVVVLVVLGGEGTPLGAEGLRELVCWLNGWVDGWVGCVGWVGGSANTRQTSIHPTHPIPPTHITYVRG